MQMKELVLHMKDYRAHLFNHRRHANLVLRKTPQSLPYRHVVLQDFSKYGK